MIVHTKQPYAAGSKRVKIARIEECVWNSFSRVLSFLEAIHNVNDIKEM